MRSRVIVLLSGLSSDGGIQRFNRNLCRALTDCSAASPVRLEILSLYDPSSWLDALYVDRPIVGCKGNRALFVMRALAALARPYDLVIIGHVDFVSFVALSRLMGRHGSALLVTHGIDVWTRLTWHKRIALQTIDCFWAVSTYTAERLIVAQGVQSEKIRIVPNTLAPQWHSEMAACRERRESPPHSSFLSVARINKGDAGKGIDRVIEALAQVSLHVPDASYTIVGDGDDRPRLEKLARDKGVADRVRFVGRVTDAEIHAYLAGTDVFVLPSRKEGFGIVYLEAMAYQKPVIAGAHGGAPEVVVAGTTGILVPHGDRAALASAMVHLLVNPEKRDTMGREGFRRVQTTYTYDRFYDTVRDTLNEILASPSWSNSTSIRREQTSGWYRG